MNNVILISHKVIPSPDPEIASGTALRGGYIVHPADAGPDWTNKDIIIITHEAKKNQYDNIFKKPDAISRAPI